MDLFELLNDAGLEILTPIEKSKLNADFGITDNDDVFVVPNGYLVLPKDSNPYFIEVRVPKIGDWYIDINK